ncbi:unnamed protein product [Ascophyllum nodosum]
MFPRPHLPLSMIIRENARLLFLYALGSNAKCDDVIRPRDFYFRLARKDDIGAISSCNLKTLPENYSPEFYDNHIKDWPDLAVVAEHVDSNNGVGQPRVIGYVLGRLEDKDTFPPTVYRDPRSRSPPSPPSTPTGHVTSLAVLPGYRRCGVAGQLMSTLHEQMLSRYRATRVSLHVRKSNRGAIRLYEEQLNYKVAGVAPAYYSDGEDAFLMQAELPDKSELPTTQQHAGSLLATIGTGAPSSSEVTAPMASSTPVLQTAATGTTIGAGTGAGSGGGGGLDREGSKGIPAGYLLPMISWVPRRPGLGCGSSCSGFGVGWVPHGETAAY